MGDTWDKIKNKGAEIKGEIKNGYENMKDDLDGRDHKDDAAYNRGARQAASGVSGAVDRHAKDEAVDRVTDRDSRVERNADGSVDTDAAEMRGRMKNEAKHQNKEERKGYNDTIDRMKN